eukprot:scaffold97033_cov57-Phaeocystis_antarctica.AAC.2
MSKAGVPSAGKRSRPLTTASETTLSRDDQAEKWVAGAVGVPEPVVRIEYAALDLVRVRRPVHRVAVDVDLVEHAREEQGPTDDRSTDRHRHRRVIAAVEGSPARGRERDIRRCGRADLDGSQSGPTIPLRFAFRCDGVKAAATQLALRVQLRLGDGDEGRPHAHEEDGRLARASRGAYIHVAARKSRPPLGEQRRRPSRRPGRSLVSGSYFRQAASGAWHPLGAAALCEHEHFVLLKGHATAAVLDHAPQSGQHLPWVHAASGRRTGNIHVAPRAHSTVRDIAAFGRHPTVRAARHPQYIVLGLTALGLAFMAVVDAAEARSGLARVHHAHVRGTSDPQLVAIRLRAVRQRGLHRLHRLRRRPSRRPGRSRLVSGHLGQAASSARHPLGAAAFGEHEHLVRLKGHATAAVLDHAPQSGQHLPWVHAASGRRTGNVHVAPRAHRTLRDIAALGRHPAVRAARHPQYVVLGLGALGLAFMAIVDAAEARSGLARVHHAPLVCDASDPQLVAICLRAVRQR